MPEKFFSKEYVQQLTAESIKLSIKSKYLL